MWIRESESAQACAASTVSSVEPSFTMISSQSWNVCARTEAIAAPI